MPKETIVTGPLDTRYTAHREEQHSREETREWLKQRERELDMAKDARTVATEPPNKARDRSPAPRSPV